VPDLDQPSHAQRTDHLAGRGLRDAELEADVLLRRRRLRAADLAVHDPPYERTGLLIAQPE